MSNLTDALTTCALGRTEAPESLAFNEYIEKVRKNPALAGNAHKRIYEMIKSYGVEVDKDTEEERYLFFEQQLFGIEAETRQVMEYFKGASLGSEVGRRFLLLFGPPSSGKSNLVSMLKDALEEFSHREAGALYAIEKCPMNEEPLHLVPGPMRDKVSKELGVKIEGELCPMCSLRLKSELAGDFTKFRVKRIFFSQQGRIGIGTFVPSDPKSQDIAELIGSVDISKIGTYGTESDPRAYRFDGELNIANRGLMEFIEILKVDQKFLYVLLTATQEHCIKTPRFPLISCDEVILTHTNEAEYKEFCGNPKNEALIDRMIVCRVKYNLKVKDEIKIYQKLLSQGDMKEVHIAPHSLKVASIFAVLSRLEDPKDKNLDKVKKMKLYDGEDVESHSKADVPRLKKECSLEGMFGVSPRYIINRLVTTAIRGADQPGKRRFMTPIDVLRSLKDGLETTAKFTPEEKVKYEAVLGLAKAEFDLIAKNEVQKAFFVSFEDEAQAMLENYLDHIEAFLDEVKIKDPLTGEDQEPDEKLMRGIETQIGITEEAKESFRNEIMRKVGAATRRGDKFRYENHARLREAIEKKLFHDRRDQIRMSITSRTKDPEELKRINNVIKTLCDKHGYIPESAEELLQYVSSLMSREK